MPLFESPVPDPLATAVDALSLPWEDLDTYAFPPAAILGKVVEKLQDSPCKRLVLIAPGRPNRPWFGDLMAISSQIPLSLPNLLTQPFNQIPHRNLKILNHHTWLLEPQQSKNRASLRQWQQGLRLLKEYQSDQSMIQSGASLIRWTSGHPLSSQLLTSLCTFFRTGSYNPAPLLVTGQALLITRYFTCHHQQRQNLTRLLESFHRDRSKGRRGIPSWNLSLVLHQLTKAPFELIQEASLKHLTFKICSPLDPWARRVQQ